ncbi:MAG TPA: prepilin-type N-terminal cleavage/methylation domain-containing protein [bacterium]|nr:prepilin-type N-terminal cleavage/methylation domain-containing protein [bacterium]HQL61568.1 prepilin-type N-terminal cleavage/methylation domain-containing protein [bacterium]
MAKHRAFTLIELLIVVAIIGILAAIAVPNFLNAQMRARLARTEADMLAFERAYDMYRLDWNVYPPHVGGHPVWQNRFVTTPVAYIASVPQDIFQVGMAKTQPDVLSYTHGEFHVDPCPGSRLEEDPALFARVRNCTTKEWRDPNYSSSTVGYFWSPGPNMIHDSGQAKSKGKIYNITNGVKSDGDLVRVVGP